MVSPKGSMMAPLLPKGCPTLPLATTAGEKTQSLAAVASEKMAGGRPVLAPGRGLTPGI